MAFIRSWRGLPEPPGCPWREVNRYFPNLNSYFRRFVAFDVPLHLETQQGAKVIKIVLRMTPFGINSQYD